MGLLEKQATLEERGTRATLDGLVFRATLDPRVHRATLELLDDQGFVGHQGSQVPRETAETPVPEEHLVRQVFLDRQDGRVLR